MADLVIAGASGFIGGLVAKLARERFRDWNIYHLVKSGCGFPENEIMLPAYLSGEGPVRATHLCLCLGTTPRRAGGNRHFVSTEHDLAVHIARRAAVLGVRQLAYISSAGASRHSKSLYLQTKARTEESLAGLGFDRLDFFRPGFLKGRPKARFSEAVGASVMEMASTFYPGLRDSVFTPLPGSTVAAAMCNALGRNAAGIFVHNYLQIAALAAEAH